MSPLQARLATTDFYMAEDINKSAEGEGASDSGGRGAPRDKDFSPSGDRMRAKRRRKVSYLTVNKIDVVDYKDVNILRRFINDRGKMLPSRQSGNTAKQQRMIARAIRRAREMALLPFVVTEVGPDRGGPRERGNYRGDRGDRYERYDNRDRDRDRAPEATPASQATAEPTAEVQPEPAAVE